MSQYLIAAIGVCSACNVSLILAIVITVYVMRSKCPQSGGGNNNIINKIMDLFYLTDPYEKKIEYNII